MKTSLEKLDAAIAKVLQEYADDVGQNVDAIAVQMAQKGAASLRAASKSSFGGTGRYAKGWTTTTERSRTGTLATIHNAQTPGLPHLLEHGHANRGGGRTPGRAHIAPVESALVDAFEREVKAKL